MLYIFGENLHSPSSLTDSCQYRFTECVSAILILSFSCSIGRAWKFCHSIIYFTCFIFLAILDISGIANFFFFLSYNEENLRLETRGTRREMHFREHSLRVKLTRCSLIRNLRSRVESIRKHWNINEEGIWFE